MAVLSDQRLIRVGHAAALTPYRPPPLSTEAYRPSLRTTGHILEAHACPRDVRMAATHGEDMAAAAVP